MLLRTLSTARAEKESEKGLIILDHSRYLEKEDFELEFETADWDEGKRAFEQLLKQFGIPERITKNKIQRFYEQKQKRWNDTVNITNWAALLQLQSMALQSISHTSTDSGGQSSESPLANFSALLSQYTDTAVRQQPESGILNGVRTAHASYSPRIPVSSDSAAASQTPSRA